jgi:hypothetical protein
VDRGVASQGFSSDIHENQIPAKLNHVSAVPKTYSWSCFEHQGVIANETAEQNLYECCLIDTSPNSLVNLAADSNAKRSFCCSENYHESFSFELVCLILRIQLINRRSKLLQIPI